LSTLWVKQIAVLLLQWRGSNEDYLMSQETPRTITLTLSEEENALLESLAREHGSEPAEALRTLLHEAMSIYDALWDKTFEESQDFLDQLADEVHAEYLAGETDDFDPDEEFDNP
jgi:hypothetical protein